MNKFFEQFEYQLNLDTNNSQELHCGNLSKKHNIFSTLINPQTNILLTAYNICEQNGLDVDLVEALVGSIEEQIQKQIEQRNLRITQLVQKNRAKKFKNDFCKYLNQTQTNCLYNDQKTQKFQSQFELSCQNCTEEQYLFRPTYYKILQTNDDENQISYEIDQVQPKPKKIQNQSDLSKQKGRQVKFKQRTVFDDLYQNSNILSIKKQNERKKSFEKLSFKPQLNKMSKKIIQMKKQNDPQYSTIWKRSLQKQISIQNKKHQHKTINKVGNSKIKSRLKEDNILISERGWIFGKKNQQKMSKSRHQVLKQIVKDNFKP